MIDINTIHSLPFSGFENIWGVEEISLWGMEGIIFSGGIGNFKQTQDNNLLKNKTCLQSFSSMNIPYKWTLTAHMLRSTWAATNMHLSHRFNICLTTLRFTLTPGPECSVPLSCPALYALWTSPTRLLCPWGFPGKNSAVWCHLLLQRIFRTQESKPHLISCICKWVLYK